MPHPVRYPNSDDEKYWNLVLEPLGVQILHEGVYDKTRSYEGMTITKTPFWFMANIRRHPVTDGRQEFVSAVVWDGRRYAGHCGHALFAQMASGRSRRRGRGPQLPVG